MRFVVRACHGFRINPASVTRHTTSAREPVGYAVLDSAVGYANCGEWWPGAKPRGEKGRGGSLTSARCRELAEVRAAELEAAYP